MSEVLGPLKDKLGTFDADPAVEKKKKSQKVLFIALVT